MATTAARKRPPVRSKAAAAAAEAARGPNVQAKYDAGGMGRRIKNWVPPSSGPARAVEGLQRIRDRSRDATRNDWAAASSVQKWTTALVGVGITPRWDDEATQEAWEEWMPFADADGVSDVYGLMALGTRSWLDGGEVFLRHRPRNPRTSRLPVPVQFQLLEAEFCPVFDAITWQGMPDGNEIRQGIERTKYGEKVAYWMFKEHPGDKYLNSEARPSPGDLIRIPASEISHMFEPTRAGQIRGVSELAPVLVRLRNAGDLEDIVLDRQKLANLYTMFITRQLPPEWDDVDWDPDTGLPAFYERDGTPTTELRAGMAHELEPGEDVKFSNPPEAGTTFSEYMRTTHMGTAAGQGLPYEFMGGDLLNISDRTLRIVVNEFRRFAEQRQWHTIIPKLCRPIVRWWADSALLAGVVSLDGLKAARTPTWQPHGWPDIHPTQDIEGRIAERDAGFTSTSDVIARKGDNPAKVLKQRKADELSGLTPPPAVKPGAPKAGDPPPNDPQAQATAALVAALTAQVSRPPAPALDFSALGAVMAAHAPQPLDVSAIVTATATALANALAPALAAIQAAASRPIALEVRGGDVHVPPAEPVINVQPSAANVEVKAGDVVVTNEVNPTPVQITNEVQPAAVQVDVNLPERETTSLIERDRAGDITKVVQTERTIN